MDLDIKKVDYYHITVEGHVAEGSKALAAIAEAGVDFLAYKAIPIESGRTRFTLFPIDDAKMAQAAEKAGLPLDGPYPAILIIGGERPGALAEIYGKLSRAGIAVEESSGIAHVRGSYGVILYVKREDRDAAAAALNA
jgi:hypothetical protein